MEFFVNLTAGIEYLKYIHTIDLTPLNFIRIQSTHLEQKLLERVLVDLDNNFLMKLAIGKECIVLDCTSRKKKNNTSRACWQGLAWIEYCLNKVWFKRNIKLKYGMHTCFEEHFKKLNYVTQKKLKYYRKFLLTDDIKLRYMCMPTDNDSNTEFYRGIVKKYTIKY